MEIHDVPFQCITIINMKTYKNYLMIKWVFLDVDNIDKHLFSQFV